MKFIVFFAFFLSSFVHAAKVNRIDHLKSALFNKYAALQMKAQRLGLNPSQHLEACAERERQATSDEFPELAFEDRLRNCLAAFADRHLYIEPQIKPPMLTVGIGIAEVSGHYVISWVNPRLLSLGGIAVSLRPGARVTHLNGQALDSELVRLEQHLSASSPAGLRKMALAALTERDFLLPTEKYLSLKLADEKNEIRLPWWALGPNARADSRAALEGVGIENVAARDPEFYTRWSDGADIVGYRDNHPLFENGLLTLYDDQFKPGLRFGVVSFNEQEACYVQLLTFQTKRWWPSKSNGGSLGFTEVFDPALHTCKQRGLPMVLDLRFNLGGDSSLPGAVASLFKRNGDALPPLLMTMPANRHTTLVVGQLNLGQGFPKPDPQLRLITNAYLSLEKALSSGASFLDFIPSPAPESSSSPTFQNPMVVLTSSNCISACERLVSMLKTANRALILGEATDGTSSGSWTFGATPAAEWRDDVDDSVVVHIPNAMFTVLDRPLADAEYLVAFDEAKHLLTENQPIQPTEGYYYQPQLRDLTESGFGWKEAIIKVLRQTSLPK